MMVSSRIVKCGVQRAEGLISTILDQGRLICQNCGTVVSDQFTRDSKDHIFYDYIGAFCQIDKAIHYRWIPNSWSLSEDPFLRGREDDEDIILPKKTEFGAEKYFVKSHYWNSDRGNCYDPGYTEVVFSDFDDSKFLLLRPTDTGYLKINNRGIHTPFIASLIEWLLKRDKWTEIADLASQSILPEREKTIIQRAVTLPTPSNIFKFIFTFRRYIPSWNSKRSLGKRSPSMLIVDELRWTANRLENLDQTDRDRLIKYGPEPSCWGVWPEIWPMEIGFGDTLADFGPEMKRIGINYGETLELINQPNIKDGERSWMELAEKILQWPINVKIGGEVDTSLSQRSERGFVTRLVDNLMVAIEKSEKPKTKWNEYLTIELPLIWEKNGANLHFIADPEFMTKSDLQETLQILKPWISGEAKDTVKLSFSSKISDSDELFRLIQSMRKRMNSTPIKIEFD